MRRQLIGLMAVCLLVPAASTAWAGSISINSGVEVRSGVEGKPVFEAWVRNDGNEAARKVQIHLEFNAQSQSAEPFDDLQPGQRKSQQFTFTDLPSKSGSYPVFLTVDFADANQYPFTAMNVGGVQIGMAPKAMIFAKADPVTIKKSAEVNVAVKNEDDVEKTVKGKVLGPREFSIKPKTLDFTLAASGTIDEKLTVENFSALPGASYPIFVVFEYESDNYHYSFPLVVQASVAAGGITAGTRNMLIGAAIGVIALLVLVEALRRLGGSRKRA